MKLSVSILSVKEKEKSIIKLNETNIDYLHIDLMDNTFTKNKAFSIREIKKISKLSNKPLDIHLMVNKPHKYVRRLNMSNIEYITIHSEINNKKYLNKVLDMIKEKGIKASLALNPKTSAEEVKSYMNKIDMVLIMSVNPGYGGQKLIPEVINKISEIKGFKENITVEVDGGINNQNAHLLNKADILVVGSYITNSENYNNQISNIKNSV